MYSGTTFRNASGNMLGAHQKIDKVARVHLKKVLPEAYFPTIREILHFEGKNGPDGIKSKSPARDEPWHYYDPTDSEDTEILVMIENHMANLTNALRKDNKERAAFEAAWLAHAIVDGLTPAHHYPLEEKLEELRGEPLETRTSIKQKLLISSIGDGRREVVRKNWEFWGAKGVMTTHLLFEIGIATAIAPLKLDDAKPDGNELVRVRSEGVVPIFKEAANHIYHMKLYEEFHRKGWTRRLAKKSRQELAPLITKVVTLAWYAAAHKAHQAKKS